MGKIKDEHARICEYIGALGSGLAASRCYLDTELENFSVWVGPDKVEFTVYNLAELHAVRRALRKVLGRWNDRLTSAYALSKTGAKLHWKSTSDSWPAKYTSIELFADPEHLPSKIGRCGFKKTSRVLEPREEGTTIEEWSFSCGKEDH